MVTQKTFFVGCISVIAVLLFCTVIVLYIYIYVFVYECVCIHKYILFQIIFHNRLLSDIEKCYLLISRFLFTSFLYFIVACMRVILKYIKGT